MFLKLNATKPEHTVSRLIRNGLDVGAPLGVFDVTESGVRLTGRFVNGTLTTTNVVTVSRNCAAVELNPAVSEILGYQPGGPTYLHPGHFGELEFPFESDPDIRSALTDLPWLVTLHLVPVTFLPE